MPQTQIKPPTPAKSNLPPSDTLTFVADDGEVIVFTGMDQPLGEATALAAEEALGKIWDRPVEDEAWRGI